MWEFTTKRSVSLENFDTRKKNDILNERNKLEKNRLDGVEETSEVSRIFSGQTMDVFKRYEGVFGDYGKRGKRVIRKFQLR